MKKNIAFIGLIIAFLLISFFGLGPAIFADGSTKERIITVSVVLVLYLIIGVCFEFLRRRTKTAK